MFNVLMLAGISCSRTNGPTGPTGPVPEPAADPPASESQGQRSVVLAGGCFWCTEAVFEQLEGVSDVVSGYAGGDEATANYGAVSRGATKHAEAIRITYDPAVIRYGQLLKVFFTVAHDPTQVNRQGPDVGPQYRSAIFYADENERQAAADYIQKLGEAGTFDRPIATTLEPLEGFYPAETYHQDFVDKNPNQGYVQVQAMPKVEKTRKQFKDLLKKDAN